MRYLYSFLISTTVLFSHINGAEAQNPSKYAVLQQQGSVCPYLPWVNLQKIRHMRARDNGRIVFQDQDYITKIQGYACFLPQIRVLDHMYDDLRARGGDYAAYEQTVRLEGIRSDQIFDQKGNTVDKIDWWPTSKARRAFFSPYNIQVNQDSNKLNRWLPILNNPGTQDFYFYDYRTNTTQKIEQPEDFDETKDVFLFALKADGTFSQGQKHRLSDEMYDQMGITRAELTKAIVTPKLLGFNQGYMVPASSEADMNRDIFWDAGTYQHMLFASGLKKDNSVFADNDDSLDAKAYREYHQAATANPLNPWATVNKEDFFEYHLSVIFQKNPALKQKAKESVNFYNDAWVYHTESFDLFDNPKEPRKKLSEKQRFMPGEDQMLAYYFSHELRMVWASSIGMDALSATHELEENVGNVGISVMKIIGKDAKDVIKKAEEKKYGSKGAMYSFLDAWDEIKQHLPQDKKDMVSFSSHGAVISFDPELIAIQDHENRPVAQRLGFEMWDSYYDKGLKPFYRKAGTAEDQIRFE